MAGRDLQENRGNTLVLYCPVETKNREMDAKVLLACVAAERGHKVYLGDMIEIRQLIEFFPRGVYLSKSIPDKMAKYFKRYKELGYAVAAWCEEGLVFLSREVYQRKMVSLGTLHYTDLFFAWGENQARAIAEKDPGSKRKIRPVGNPRMDLLREPFREIYRNEAERLRSEYGQFILFNTNFAAANNVVGAEYAFEDSKRRGKTTTKEEEEHYWNFFDHRREILERMKELVATVSRFRAAQRIVVRPHPSENHDTWREVAKELDNVEVIFEGNVVPWLMAASVVIHNGCTTAVEAFLLETPAIAYQPVIKEGYELELPNRISVRARTEQEVLDAIEFTSNQQPDYARWRESVSKELKDYMAEAEGEYASSRILEELEGYYADIPIVPEHRIYQSMRLGKHRIKEFLRTVRYGETLKRSKESRPGLKHRRQKMPDMSIDEMRALVAQFRSVSGRFDDVRISRVSGYRRSFLFQCE